MSINFKEVGERISKCRRKAGLKQYQVCEMIDVNYNGAIYVYNYASSLFLVIDHYFYKLQDYFSVCSTQIVDLIFYLV